MNFINRNNYIHILKTKGSRKLIANWSIQKPIETKTFAPKEHKQK